MNTPAELILAISLTPIAFTTVVNTIRMPPRRTPFSAASLPSAAEPTSWKPDQSWGSTSW